MPTFDLQFDVTWLTLVATVILPMIVALATARIANPGIKAATLAVLALIVSIVNEWLLAGGLAHIDLSGLLVNFLTTFLGAVGLHFGLLKPFAITGATGKIQLAVPAGLGNTDTTGAHERYDEAA